MTTIHPHSQKISIIDVMTNLDIIIVCTNVYGGDDIAITLTRADASIKTNSY